MDCALRQTTFDFNPFLAVVFSRLGSVSPVTTLAKIRIYGNQRAKKTQYSQAQCCSENVQSLICAHLCYSKHPAHHVIAQVNRSELALNLISSFSFGNLLYHRRKQLAIPPLFYNFTSGLNEEKFI